MGLFDKKNCDICGNTIKFLGNRKLEDGNMCKSCYEKCSPYLGASKRYTVEEMKNHLAYRQENEKQLENFNPTTVLGISKKIYIDDAKGLWLVSGANDYKAYNPDIFAFGQITGCNVVIDEIVREEEVEIPSHGNVRIDINGRSDRGPTVAGRAGHTSPANNFTKGGSGAGEAAVPTRTVKKYTYNVQLNVNLNHPWVSAISFNVNNNELDKNSVEYYNVVNIANDIKTALTQIHTETLSQAAPKASVICPHCGAVTTPDKANCCEFCGLNVNA